MCIAKAANLITPGMQPKTVEPSISDHPKCKGLVVAYGRVSITGVEPHGATWGYMGPFPRLSSPKLGLGCLRGVVVYTEVPTVRL